jgi:hypothetical protein
MGTAGNSSLFRSRNVLLLLALMTTILVVVGGTALRGSDESASKSELRHIQSAVSTMMVHNSLISIPNPVTEPTDDLTRFPDTATPPEQKGLQAGDKPGYLLFGHDNVADGLPESRVDYVRFDASRWMYSVSSDGTVTQGEKSQD